jgi:imidazolonepropionase-like amidohydrolase
MTKKLGLFFGIFLQLVAAAGAQETILIQNGTIVPVVGNSIQNGSLLIEDGKIARIGTNIDAPRNAHVIDAKGMYVYPGMIAPFTGVGVTGFPGAGSDMDELGASTPHMDPVDAINAEDDCIEVTRIDGVTTVLTTSGSRGVLNGKAVVLNLEGNLADELILEKDVLQVFNTAAKTDDKYPSTLPGVNALIRDKLNEAKRYAEKNDKEGDEPAKRDLEMEALVPVVQGEMPVLFVTSDDVTIRNALRLMDEYGLKGIIYANKDIVEFADELAARKIPVIWAGTSTLPEVWEPVDLNYHSAAVLEEKGVLFAFNESRRGPGSRNARRQPVPAAISVAYGLSEEEAIKAITINPAKILGIDDKVGSLEEGKIANVVICTKPLIQLSSKIDTVIINGKVVPMTSFQTRLRDKFEKIVKERMRKKKAT